MEELCWSRQDFQLGRAFFHRSEQHHRGGPEYRVGSGLRQKLYQHKIKREPD